MLLSYIAVSCHCVPLSAKQRAHQCAVGRPCVWGSCSLILL